MKITFLSFLVGFCFGQTPSWYMQAELPGYPVSQYYVGVGEGPSFEDAQSIAQASIASQLSVTIESAVETFVQEIEGDDRSEYLDVFRKSTKSTVNATVTGIEIVKNKKAGKVFYVFAALDKSQFLAGLEVELDDLWGRTTKLVQDARNYISEGKIFIALENYTDAQEVVVPFYTKKAFYDALSPAPYFITETITVSGLTSEIRGVLAGVNIEVTTGDKQSAKAGTLLRDPITFHVYYKGSGSENTISIPNMPLTLKAEDGSIIERGSTNQHGNLETYITATPVNTKYGKVVARPNLFRLPGLYKKYLKNAEGVTTYSVVEHAPVAFALIIRDEKGARLPNVETKLSKSIQKLGHSVSDNAELTLEGSVDITSEKEVEGISGLQYMVSSELSLLMMVNATGDKVASFTAVGKGLSPKSQKKATKASYRKLNIKKKDLADMLSQAESHLDRAFETQSIKSLKQGKSHYKQGKLSDALGSLALVTRGETSVSEALELIAKIKAEMNTAEIERIESIQKQKASQ
ncbi:LPP20 family lipoprotein [bacterium]|nr:LPP20 family lipoprotein [bacterium]